MNYVVYMIVFSSPSFHKYFCFSNHAGYLSDTDVAVISHYHEGSLISSTHFSVKFS